MLESQAKYTRDRIKELKAELHESTKLLAKMRLQLKNHDSGQKPLTYYQKHKLEEEVKRLSKKVIPERKKQLSKFENDLKKHEAKKG